MHICTTQSLRAGLEMIAPKECNICGHDTLFYSYISLDCDVCGNTIDGEFIGYSLRQIRAKAGWSRRDYSNMSGYAMQTIRNNEFTQTSNAYIDQFKNLIKEFYNEKTRK